MTVFEVNISEWFVFSKFFQEWHWYFLKIFLKYLQLSVAMRDFFSNVSIIDFK